MEFETRALNHILENNLGDVSYFLSHTAFVVCHKSEPLDSLRGVLWHLPVDSPVLVVTNCPASELADLKRGLVEQLSRHTNLHLIHQKDARIARFFHERGVKQLLDHTGRVADGKGEGMYIGALCAALLGYPRWLLFYDADNFIPTAILEYNLALGKLFLSKPNPSGSPGEGDVLLGEGELPTEASPTLHNVRIAWASKPDWKGGLLSSKKVLGRCTRVISPVINTLLSDRFGLHDAGLVVSNAGEQGMTMNTARSLRFSSGFSVETFQLLDLLARAAESQTRVLLQQYEARSVHVHEKKDDKHIKQMIAESLGCFFLYESLLSEKARRQLWHIIETMDLPVTYPRVYPALWDLAVQAEPLFVARYRLSPASEAHVDDAREEEDTSFAS